MNLTDQQLLKIYPNARSLAGVFVSPLNVAMARHRNETHKRSPPFLAPVGPESGPLQYQRELRINPTLSK